MWNKLPLVFVIFVLFLLFLYVLIMGVECCDYCKSQKKKTLDGYTEIKDHDHSSSTTNKTGGQNEAVVDEVTV